jgi:undecaprenyl-diphosphatase
MCAVVLSNRRSAPAWFTLAALVASSRVYVRMHHASDVAGGALLGLALGGFARRFVRGRRESPSRHDR